jgi:hypothetical protein
MLTLTRPRWPDFRGHGERRGDCLRGEKLRGVDETDGMLCTMSRIVRTVLIMMPASDFVPTIVCVCESTD